MKLLISSVLAISLSSTVLLNAVNGCASNCEVELAGECQDSFTSALENAKNGNTLIVRGATLVTKSAKVSAKDLTIRGEPCDGENGTILIDMGQENSDKRTSLTTKDVASIVFENENELTLKDLTFRRRYTSMNTTYATALYAKREMNLDIQNCNFIGLRSPKLGGSSIHLEAAGQSVEIKGGKFDGNSVADGGCYAPYCIAPNGGPDLHLCPDSCFGGGGTVWIGTLYEGSKIDIDSVFTNNIHEFGHGMGGAIFMDYIEGDVNIDGTYINNTSADGGAVHIESVEGSSNFNIDGTYKSNKALDGGWGGRGAALRLRDVSGKVNVKGVYNQNSVEGRGAVMAFNNLDGADVNMKVNAQDNSVTKTGTVVDNWKKFVNSKFVLEADSTISGNTAGNAKTNVLNFSEQGIQLDESQFNDETQNGKDYILSS